MRRFRVVREGSKIPTSSADLLVLGQNLLISKSHLVEKFGNLSTLEIDLLALAAAIFAADRASARGEREDITRCIELTIPIANVTTILPLAAEIEEILYRLSNDNWTIKVEPYHESAVNQGVQQAAIESSGKTLLFSGGLDSLAAAIEFGKEDGLCLVSHRMRNSVTNGAQEVLVGKLRKAGYEFPHIPVFVSSRSGGPSDLDHAEENSQRTRSFLFLVLGALVARRLGHRQLVMLAENGQMAIHLPLTSGRVGAFSTHTAHPAVLYCMQEFLSTALETELQIINPYVYLTKKEVTEKIWHALPDAIADANSCWRNARLPASATHCGECVPCFIRRIGIEMLGEDQTSYARDPWILDFSRLKPDDTARRNLADLAEFAHILRRSSPEEIMSEWPELYDRHMDPTAVIAMYRRFADDLIKVFSRYPGLAPLLS